MKLLIPQEKFVVATRYKNICDHVHSYTYSKDSNFHVHVEDSRVFLKQVQNDPSDIISVYCKTDYVFELFTVIRDIKKKVILFTGCSDYSIDEEIYKKKPKNVIYWFAENINYDSEYLIPTPIGSTVATWIGDSAVESDLREHKDYQKITTNGWENEKMLQMLLSFSLNTNYGSRRHAYNYFKESRFVANYCSEDSNNRLLTEAEFCRKINQHQFVFSPPGNGIDCGRTWVALQLGSIPVVQSSILTEKYRDKLPIFIYDRVEQVTEEKLLKFYEKVRYNKNYEYDLLNIEYYSGIIYKIKKGNGKYFDS